MDEPRGLRPFLALPGRATCELGISIYTLPSAGLLGSPPADLFYHWTSTNKLTSPHLRQHAQYTSVHLRLARDIIIIGLSIRWLSRLGAFFSPFPRSHLLDCILSLSSLLFCHCFTFHASLGTDRTGKRMNATQRSAAHKAYTSKAKRSSHQSTLFLLL